MDDRWLAGLLEGEGCFSLHKQNTGTGYRVAVIVSMTDQDVIESVHKVAGVGHIGGPYEDKRDNHSDYWKWWVGNREEVKTLLLRVRPYMHKRRTDKIDTLLAAIEGMESKRQLPRGVYVDGDKYRTYFQRNNKRIEVGRFDTVEEAVEARNKARRAFLTN